MIRFQELKTGDYVLAEFEGKITEGEVINLNRDEKEVCVKTGEQEYWYKPEELQPITLNEEQLMRLNFAKQETGDGTVKYMKGAFRILTPSQNAFSRYEIWYRDEKRQMLNPIAVHELQNHYLEMTKVHLTDEVFSSQL